MKIVIDTHSLRELSKELTAISPRMSLAIARGLNEGGDKARTRIQHVLQKQTGLLKYASVTSRIDTVRAHQGQLEYMIVGKGKPATRIYEFAYSVKLGPGGGVSAKMWGVDHLFARSFQIKGKSDVAAPLAIRGRQNPGALRARLGEQRHPIRGFFGPSIAKELVKDDSAQTFERAAATLVEPAIRKHVAKLLGAR